MSWNVIDQSTLIFGSGYTVYPCILQNWWNWVLTLGLGGSVECCRLSRKDMPNTPILYGWNFAQCQYHVPKHVKYLRSAPSTWIDPILLTRRCWGGFQGFPEGKGTEGILNPGHSYHTNLPTRNRSEEVGSSNPLLVLVTASCRKSYPTTLKICLQNRTCSFRGSLAMYGYIYIHIYIFIYAELKWNCNFKSALTNKLSVTPIVESWEYMIKETRRHINYGGFQRNIVEKPTQQVGRFTFSREALVWVKHLEPLGFRTGQFLVVSGEWFCDLCIQPSIFANLGIPIKGDHRF
jgi:hypothetical protein